MKTRSALAQAEPASSSDERLISACLAGDAEAWAALIEKYKNLIFSIPIRDGFTPEDAADIFQSVCVDLISELSRLREPRALPAWLIRVTSRRCSHRKRQERRFVPLEAEETGGRDPVGEGDPPDACVRQLEQEQLIREAISDLSPRCRELVRMLFFEDPPRPYRDVARQLGIATGSIGFIRGRCLKRLRRRLEDQV